MPRGGQVLRYCPVCGKAYEVLSYAPQRPAVRHEITGGEGLAAVLAGILSLLPMCGLLFALVAAGMAVSMLIRNRGPQRAAVWDATAIITLVFAAVGTCVWLAVL